MRIKNKIIIEGDTLKIFEAVTPERRRELEQIAKEIYNNSGNSDANERGKDSYLGNETVEVKNGASSSGGPSDGVCQSVVCRRRLD
jgi:hypothetical protein